MAAFKILGSEVIFTGRAFGVRRDLLQTPDGRETRLDIVDHVGSVVIVPVDSAGNVLFVRQYRHPTGQELLELPAGMVNENEAGETCARREIREETGNAARNMLLLGGFYLAPGYCTEYMQVYLATDLEYDPLDPDTDEFLTLERIPVARALELAEHGELQDAKSLAALFMAKQHLHG